MAGDNGYLWNPGTNFIASICLCFKRIMTYVSPEDRPLLEQIAPLLPFLLVQWCALTTITPRQHWYVLSFPSNTSIFVCSLLTVAVVLQTWLVPRREDGCLSLMRNCCSCRWVGCQDLVLLVKKKGGGGGGCTERGPFSTLWDSGICSASDLHCFPSPFS